MDPNQALAILQQACPQISTTLAQHQLIQQALSTLREALIPDPVPNQPEMDPDGAGARPVNAFEESYATTDSRQPQ